MKIIDCIEGFIRHLRFERRSSAHTVIAYETDLKQFQIYLIDQYEIDRPVDVKGIFIRSWLAELKSQQINDRSLRRKASALRSFFKYLMKLEIVEANPVRQVVLPKISKQLPQFLERKQTELLISGSLPTDTFEEQTERLIIELLYQTGMRRAELINIREKDVNFQRRELSVLGKGKKERVLPLGDPILADIEVYINLKKKTFEKSTDNLLSLKSGKQLYDKYVYRVVKKYLTRITTLDKKGPHLLRHTFATQLLNNGADLMAIKDLLGHSSLASTQVYTSVNIEQLKEIYKNAHPKS